MTKVTEKPLAVRILPDILAFGIGLALAYFLKVDSFLVYAVVYFVYFFPWRESKELLAEIQNRQTPSNARISRGG